MNTTHNARYGNLAQLFPFGRIVQVILVSRNELDRHGFGKLIFTDGLGVCIHEDGSPAFYPWGNVVRIAEASE